MASVTIFAAVALLVWTVVYYTHWVVLRRRFVAIAPGRVYQSGAMSPRLLMRYARRYSIATVIDFRCVSERGVFIEKQALEKAGVRHVNIPIGILPTRDDLRHFIEVMHAELSTGATVLMHCKDGEGRAIAFAAIYRIEFEGWNALEAYRAATRLPPGFRPISILFPGAGLLSPRNVKTQFILDYRPLRSPPETSTSAWISQGAGPRTASE